MNVTGIFCSVEALGVLCGKRQASDEEETILFVQDSEEPAVLKIKAYWTGIGEILGIWWYENYLTV
jgi:hypothetical protein